mgnify:CR=1 FL=1
MATIKSTDESFDTLVKENKVIIFDFWASWCGPCLKMTPLLEEISEEMKDVKIAKKQFGNFNVLHGERRDGDPPQLIANADRIKTTLGWQPIYNDLDLIIQSAVEFEKLI